MKRYFVVLAPKGQHWEELNIQANDCQQAAIGAMLHHTDEHGGTATNTRVRVWYSKDDYRNTTTPLYEASMTPTYNNGCQLKLTTNEMYA